jgi:nitroreductase
MGNFDKLIAKRRSMRKFTAEQLTAEEVKLILRAALIAPTSKHTNGWQFVAVDDRELLDKLADCKDNGSLFLKEAPFAVVVLGDPTKTDAWIEDCAIAAFNMQLQAEDLGLGSCWAHFRNRFTAEGVSSKDAICELLAIPEPYEPLCAIAFGHKGMERKLFDEDRLQWEKVHINGFDISRE